MGGDGRIHLLVQHLGDLLGQRTGQIPGRRGRHGRGRVVRVVDGQSRRHRVGRHGEHGTGHVGLIGARDYHGEITVTLDVIGIAYLAEGNEGQRVAELRPLQPGDLDEKPELVLSGFLVPDLDDPLDGLFADAHQDLGADTAHDAHGSQSRHSCEPFDDHGGMGTRPIVTLDRPVGRLPDR